MIVNATSGFWTGIRTKSIMRISKPDGFFGCFFLQIFGILYSLTFFVHKEKENFTDCSSFANFLENTCSKTIYRGLEKVTSQVKSHPLPGV